MSKSSAKRFLVLFSIGSCIVAAGAACSFPDVSFAPDDFDASQPMSEAGTDGMSGGDAAKDSFVAPPLEDAAIFDAKVDGQDPDAAISKDAGSAIDAGGCPVAECDCDHDTYNDTKRPGCSGAAGTPDCDDTHDAVHPNESGYHDTPNQPNGGDWNCANGVEKFYAINVNCGLLAVGVPCAGLQGFSGDPACGASGEYVFCVPQGPLNALCGVGSKTTKTQACQ